MYRCGLDHHWSYQQEASRVRGKDLQSLDKSWGPLFCPNWLSPDLLGIVELGAGLALCSDHNDPDTSSFKCSSGQRSNTRSSTWSKVDSVCSGSWEVGSFSPVNVLDKDLITERCGKRGGQLTQVGTCIESADVQACRVSEGRLTILGVVYTDRKVGSGPKLLSS